MTFSNQLNNIKALYAKYIKDGCVFKTCGNTIVIMRKLPDTKDNEARQVVDHNCAKFRADKLEVVLIFDIFNPTVTYDVAQNSAYTEKIIEYKVGKVVSVDDYEDNIEKVCAPGIHYFNTIDLSLIHI